MAACVFCSIVEQGDELVFSGDGVAAFLDIKPVFHGHVLIVPTMHAETLTDVPSSTLTTLFETAQLVMRALDDAVGAEGTFVAVNNRISQSVPHLHVHVVPRKKGDGLRGFFWPRHAYPDDAAREAMRDKVRAAIAEVFAARPTPPSFGS